MTLAPDERSAASAALPARTWTSSRRCTSDRRRRQLSTGCGQLCVRIDTRCDSLVWTSAAVDSSTVQRVTPLGGDVQPAEDAPEADEHRPVAAAPDSQVAQHDHDDPEDRAGRASAPAPTAGSRISRAGSAACSASTMHARLVLVGDCGRSTGGVPAVGDSPGLVPFGRHAAAGLALRRRHGGRVVTSSRATRSTRRRSTGQAVRRAAGPRDRQLRQLRLQPRAVPRGARRRAGRAPPRRARPSTRRWRSSPTRCCSRPGPGRPEDAGILVRRDPRLRRARRPGARRVPRPPGIGQVYGGDDRAGAAGDARQDVARSATTATGVFAGLPDPLDGDPLPLAGRRPRHACPTASRSPPRPTTAS